MSSPLPTLNDMLNPDKNKAPRVNPEEQREEKKEEQIFEEVKEEPKKLEAPPVEEVKEEKEEPKKQEAPPVEEVKKEEEKKEEEQKEEEQPKVEEQPKKKKKIPKRPREPEPKVPTDFRELIKELKDIKNAGNDLYKKESYEEAISKYKEGYEQLEKQISQINLERSYNPQSEELITLYKQFMSNLSLCYSKTEKYQESIDLDLKLISVDQNYDKAYQRLFNNYLKINKKDQAVYFGDIFLKFDEETIKRYEGLKETIEETKKSLQAEYDAIRAKERKEMLKSIGKYAIPVVILIAAVAIYFLVFKKKQIAK
jgi:tetratricopeptide (TPR) repeat protein